MKDTEEKTMTVDAAEKLVINVGGETVLTVEKGQITLAAGVKIKAEGVIIQAESLKTEVSGDLVMKAGRQTMIEGSTLELKAAASGKLNSDGMLELKGAMIKLN